MKPVFILTAGIISLESFLICQLCAEVFMKNGMVKTDEADWLKLNRIADCVLSLACKMSSVIFKKAAKWIDLLCADV